MECLCDDEERKKKKDERGEKKSWKILGQAVTTSA